MNYIVFDLEWNQGTVDTTVSKIPFEIVEIGAVKLNQSLEAVDTFQILVNPKVYDVINYQTHKVMPLEMKELRAGGVAFPDAVRRFFQWCGDDKEYVFCTWSNMDLTELQKNMDYYQLEFPGATPIRYYDVQRGFGICFGGEGNDKLVALEEAVAKLGIKESTRFHRALEDARYTAAVMRHVGLSVLEENFSLDCYHNPKSKGEEIHVRYADHSLYVSREFPNKEALMKDLEIRSTRCLICNKNARRKIRWYCSNSRIYHCLAHCEKHGLMVGKIRMKKTEQSRFYAEKILKMADKEEARYVAVRQQELRERRREKKKRAKEKKTAAG